MPHQRSASIHLKATSGPPGWYASPAGSATGAGTIADPWTLAQAFLGGYPTNSIQPGDNIYLRSGTYTGQFTCLLNGTAGNYITFRNYPGERATIDGNFDNGSPGNTSDTIWLKSTGSYVRFRGIEIMNSQTNRFFNLPPSPPGQAHRGFAFNSDLHHAQIINCILHDCGQGINSFDSAHDSEYYGNLIYHNGWNAPSTEPFTECAIDLAPAAGTPVAFTGSTGSGGSYTPSKTISYNHTGDAVVAFVNSMSTAYGAIAATYGGVSMGAAVNGYDSGAGGESVAIFVLTNGQGAATGTHDLVVTASGGGVVRAVVHSAVNVHQTAPASAKGHATSYPQGNYLPPFTNTVASATNHLVVDVAELYHNFSGYSVSGDNTSLFSGTCSVGSQYIAVSSASGGASVAMGWTWTPATDGYGHGTYCNNVTGAVGKHLYNNIFYDGIGDNCFQCYGSGSSAFINSEVKGNIAVNSGIVVGGSGGGFLLTNTTVHDNWSWNVARCFIGYKSDDAVSFQWIDNYIHDNAGKPEKAGADADIITHGNTFIGTQNFTDASFGVTPSPPNTYYTGASTPATNVSVVLPNAYESNRCNIAVYNWENLTTVDVDISSAVAVGTPIHIMNAQDYYATPVWSGTYSGGTVTLPMTGLTAAAGIGYTADGPTGQGFNAFIVRAQSEETWR